MGVGGISSGTRTITIGSNEINNEMVLQNMVVFGSVNAAGATTSKPRTHWPKPTGHGWNASSPAGFR